MAVGLASGFLAVQASRLGASKDLGFLWIAGRLWNEGRDAYSSAFEVLSRQLLDPVGGWKLSYPPQWWGFCRAIALLPFATAARVWHFGSLVSLVAAAVLLWRTGDHLRVPAPLWVRALLICVLFTHETVGATLTNGQTSLLMLLGVALIGGGAMRQSILFTAAGLFVVMLKPNIGLPFVMVAMMRVDTRKGLLLAIVVTAIACLPLLAPSTPGAVTMMSELVHNISGYNAPGSFNAPERMTGITRFLPGIPTSLTAVLAGGVAAGLILFGARRAADRVTGEAIWLHSAAAIAALNSLHNYDLTFSATPLLLLHRLRRLPQLTLLIGILMIHSARRLGGLLHPVDLIATQAAIATLGGIFMLMAGVVTAAYGFRGESGR